ncbi:MAG: hypothetical protein ABIJ52_10610 [Pseudomonadota bacterium]
MICKREFIGEALGTFILVLFGCGSVALFFVRMLEPAMKRPSDRCDCEADKPD